MAYDLLRVAPEREIPPFKPAWLVWAFLFVVMVGGGAFCVVRFWPADEPTGTLWFWTCVAVFPSMVWAVSLFTYLGILQAERQRAVAFNAARNQYFEQVVHDGGVPQYVLDSGFLFSVEETENTAQTVARQQLTLEPRQRFAGDGDSVQTRWIKPDSLDWRPGSEDADEARHREVLPYMFDALLARVASTLRALPNGVPVKVRLSIAAQLSTQEIEACWSQAVLANQLNGLTLAKIGAVAPELILVDRWVDEKDIATDAVTLLCVVQLNVLLNACPAQGSAEAGVIFLFAPAAFAAKKQLADKARLFRPERCDEQRIGQGLRQALLWSRARVDSLVDHWMTGGVNAPLNRVLTSHLSLQKVGVAETERLSGQHDIDMRIGAAGIAGGWLCVALALEHAAASGRPQLCSVAGVDHLTIAVAAPHR
jgi:hypothetical protein